MRISQKYLASDWKKLDLKNEDDWRTAVDIFRDRIHERFLNPIRHIEDLDFAGFAVMALDCLLIEMLQQFREGVNRTPSGKSKDFFILFLTETDFGEDFDERMALLFYRQIRCGILHQAELRGSSKILARDGLPLVEYAPDERGLYVNRKLFHERLVSVFEKYTMELLDPAKVRIREKFLNKMMSICRVACEIE